MKISGRRSLHEKLAALPAVVKSEIRKALATSAQEIVQLQRRAVPVKSGELRDTILWQHGDVQKIAHSQGVGGGHELSVRISAGDVNVRYAHLVEFGAAPHMIGTRQHPGAPAQPFFYPMYRLGKKRAKSRVTRAVNTAARKVAASTGGRRQ